MSEPADLPVIELSYAIELLSKKLEQGNYEIQMRYKVKNQDFLQVVTWYNK